VPYGNTYSWKPNGAAAERHLRVEASKLAVNPKVTFQRLVYGNTSGEAVTISLFSLSGRIIRAYSVDAGTILEQNLSALPPGLIIYQIEGEVGTVRGKLVLQPSFRP